MHVATQERRSSHECNASRLPKSVLCYVRPWNVEQFALLARTAFPDAVITHCSEHRSVDPNGLSAGYYRYLRAALQLGTTDHPLIASSDTDDMIARCRLLRRLSRSEARRNLYAMAQAVDELLANRKPEVLLSLTVDSYVIDLIRHFCSLMGIRFVGLVPTFVNGYFRVTSRGERTLNPVPDMKAIEHVRRLLLDTEYAPTFVQNAIAHPRRGVLRRWASNAARFPYFWIKRHVSRDPYNFHFRQSEFLSADCASVLPPTEPGREDWQSILEADQRPALYIPLQMFPESTVDYWSGDVRAASYYDTLDKLVETHHKAFNIVLKEHPAVMGYRPRGFYSRLRTDSRITVVPTYTPSNYVLDRVPSVLVWTGTVGYEAALRGKAVFTLCDPYYATGKRFLKIDRDTESDVLLNHVVASARADPTPEEQDELLHFLVVQLFKGSYTIDGSWNASNPKQLQDVQRMAMSLRALLTGIVHKGVED